MCLHSKRNSREILRIQECSHRVKYRISIFNQLRIYFNLYEILAVERTDSENKRKERGA